MLQTHITSCDLLKSYTAVTGFSVPSLLPAHLTGSRDVEFVDDKVFRKTGEFLAVRFQAFRKRNGNGRLCILDVFDG